MTVFEAPLKLLSNKTATVAELATALPETSWDCPHYVLGPQVLEEASKQMDKLK